MTKTKHPLLGKYFQVPLSAKAEGFNDLVLGQQFKVVKVGRRYLTAVNANYGGEGNYRFEITDIFDWFIKKADVGMDKIEALESP